VSVPSGFDRVRLGRTLLVVRHDDRDLLTGVLGDAISGAAAAEPLAGGRGGTVLMRRNGQAVVVRPYRRGGLPGRCIRDLYVGWHPRPLRELAVTTTLWRAGAPVPEALGAAVQPLCPGVYRGWLATRYIPGAQTLWAWAAREAEDPLPAFRAAGRGLRRLHDLGGVHPDLNLNNILVIGGDAREAELQVTFIDFDRARVEVLGARARAAALARLARSAHKLDPAARHVGERALDALRAAYREAG
jgi:3-deoxy-D-manno-octulosonic acid kinase